MDGADEFDAGEDPNASPVSPQQLIGGTPILDLSAYSLNPNVRILPKRRYLNPSGSIKDRVAQHMLSNAERTGRLKPGMTVVAATSGNTGSAIRHGVRAARVRVHRHHQREDQQGEGG